MLEKLSYKLNFQPHHNNKTPLFTNIPTYLAIKNVMEKWENIKQNTHITKSKFLQILNFCLRDNNYFKYMDQTYIQIFGMNTLYHLL